MNSHTIAARLFAGIVLIVFWGLVDSPLSGVSFLLAMAALSIIRYRLAPYRWLGAAEAAVCAGFAFVWTPALLGLWLPVIGLLEDQWIALERELFGRDYRDRAERFKLEADLLTAARERENAARLAEATERARIAQDIHDHVGHEISGASIALQAAVKLYEKGDARAGELLAQTGRRLESASAHLRETVHNLKPPREPGAESLEELCAAFTFCPVSFTASGNLDDAGAGHWALLAANLKEALTNTARHSRAGQVTVRLDGNQKYIRMLVSDDGAARARGAVTPGLGLSGMAERVRAAGGTMSVSAQNGFQIVCILPKRSESE